jgi:histidinol phosphatase-like PHP family hydrolase
MVALPSNDLDGCLFVPNRSQPIAWSIGDAPNEGDGMVSPLMNLHNHTPFSDGAYLIDEIIEAHLELDPQPDGIGISDHLFLTPSSREITSEKEYTKVFGDERRAYVDGVRAAREQFSGQIEIFCGAEINWPLNKPFLPQIINMLDGIDYVLFEFVDWAGLTLLANQARRFPCPVILAHTEIATQFPNTSMDQVVRTMANARLIYEISSKFMPLSQSDPWFRLLPKHRVKVCIGTDTHDDLSVLGDVARIGQYIEDMNLAEKVFQPTIRDSAPVAQSS